MEIVGPKPAPISVCVPVSAGAVRPRAGNSADDFAGIEVGGPTPASAPGGSGNEGRVMSCAGAGGFGCGSDPLDVEVGGPSPSCACRITIGNAIARHATEIRIGKNGRIFGVSTGVMPSRANKEPQSGWRVSGRVGVPPAVRCVPHSTRRTSTGNRSAFGVRVYSAGREIRQARRPPYPRHAARLLHASDELHKMAWASERAVERVHFNKRK